MFSEAARTASGEPAIGFPGLDRKRTVLLLRSMVIATAAYLVVAGSGRIGWPSLALLGLLITSNVALAFAPPRVFWSEHFGPVLLLADTLIILAGFSWSHGISQELLLAYFFTLFLITACETIGQIAVGSALVAGLYGYWLWSVNGVRVSPEDWVPLPFFFLVAVFYASLLEQLKRERRRRQLAEGQNRHLRFLLDLANAFSESHPNGEFLRSLGRFVEGTCPGLECQLALGAEASGTTFEGEVFPLRAHGREYGALRVQKVGARRLLPRETWLCQMVAHAAAGALYAAEQSNASASAAQAKEQFLAAISHEFRTPLHAILGYQEMLASLLPSDADPDLSESVERTRVNAERLQSVLEELLSFAEIHAGQCAVDAESFELRGLLEELVPDARRGVQGRPVSVIWEVEAGVPEVHTDREKLRRALSCLIGNAVKFTEAGCIAVSVTSAEPGWVEVSIDDTGVGMAQSDLAVAFEDFRQVDGSATRPYGGLGIGLSLAREIVELLGGKVDVQSEVGRGTAVRVALPIDARNPDPGARSQSPGSRCGAESRSWRGARTGVGRTSLSC